MRPAMGFRRSVPIALAAALLASTLVPHGAAAAVSGRAEVVAAPLGSEPRTDAIPVPAGATLRAMDPTTPMRIGLTLGYDHPGALARLLSGLEDPTSPQYRHFLSYASFEREFAPPAQSVSAVESYLESRGGAAVQYVAGTATVEATVPSGALDRLFSVHAVEYSGPAGAAGFTTLGAVQLPASLRGQVVGVEGLSGDLGPARPTALTHLNAPVRSAADLPSLFVQDAASGEE